MQDHAASLGLVMRAFAASLDKTDVEMDLMATAWYRELELGSLTQKASMLRPTSHQQDRAKGLWGTVMGLKDMVTDLRYTVV
jgi:hypothetical protein